MNLLNINGYNVSNIEIPEEQLMAMPPELRAFFPKGAKGFNVTTSHNIVDDSGNEKSMNLDFEEESLGTKNMGFLELIDVMGGGALSNFSIFQKSPILISPCLGNLEN